MYYPFTIVQFIGMEILKNVYCSLSNKKKNHNPTETFSHFFQ